MAEQLFLRLTDSGREADAVVVSADGRLLRGMSRMALTQAASLAEGRRVSVLIPASDAVVVAAEIPKASAARMRNLLPFSLEDHFATDVEDLHFAAGRVRPDGQVAATVIARSRLESVLEQLADAEIEPQAVYAAADGVPDTPSTTTILLDRDSIMGRLPDRAAFNLEGLSLDAVWALLTEEEPDAAGLHHVMVYGSAECLAERGEEIDRLRQLVTDVDTRALTDGGLSLLAATLTSGLGTNLLQGRYAPRSNVAVVLRPWYPAAALALTLFLVTLISTGTELVRLRQADSALLEQAQSLCAERFGTPQLSTCQAEARRRLASVGQATVRPPDSFLEVLRAVANAADTGSLETVSYRNNVLNLDMRLPDVAELDAFAQRVAAESQFAVRTLSNTPEDDGLKSRLQVLVRE